MKTALVEHAIGKTGGGLMPSSNSSGRNKWMLHCHACKQHSFAFE
jgi:hypothetical protein